MFKAGLDYMEGKDGLQAVFESLASEAIQNEKKAIACEARVKEAEQKLVEAEKKHRDSVSRHSMTVRWNAHVSIAKSMLFTTKSDLDKLKVDVTNFFIAHQENVEFVGSKFAELTALVATTSRQESSDAVSVTTCEDDASRDVAGNQGDCSPVVISPVDGGPVEWTQEKRDMRKQISVLKHEISSKEAHMQRVLEERDMLFQFKDLYIKGTKDAQATALQLEEMKLKLDEQENLQDNLMCSQKQLYETYEECKKLRKEIGPMSQELGYLRGEKPRLEGLLGTAEQKLEKLQYELGSAQEKIKALEKSRTSNSDQSQQLVAQIEEKDKTNAQLKECLANYSEEVSRLKSQVQEKEKKLSEESSKVAKLEKSLLKSARKTAAEHQKKLEKLVTAKDDLRKKLDASQDAESLAIKENGRLTKELSTAVAARDEKTRLLGNQIDIVASLEAQVGSLREQIQEQKRRIGESDAKIRDLESRPGSTSPAGSEGYCSGSDPTSALTIAQLKRELQEAREKVQVLTEDLEDLENEHQEYKKYHAEVRFVYFFCQMIFICLYFQAVFWWIDN